MFPAIPSRGFRRQAMPQPENYRGRFAWRTVAVAPATAIISMGSVCTKAHATVTGSFRGRKRAFISFRGRPVLALEQV